MWTQGNLIFSHILSHTFSIILSKSHTERVQVRGAHAHRGGNVTTCRATAMRASPCISGHSENGGVFCANGADVTEATSGGSISVQLAL